MPKDAKSVKNVVPKNVIAKSSVIEKVTKQRKPPSQGPVSNSTGNNDIPVKELEERRKQMQEQLLQVEVQIFKLETQYIEKANPRGNALKGYEGLLTSVSSSVNNKGTIRAEDRIFSNSSITAGSL
ncbi:hypothetical protein CEUSTIGMA_g7389.t1 [Chlamydomonas eustigma]|uniref:Chromatin modification-related protein EAF6 n=1 Tax=Chlamydomonas eustigma TaxID=1157962 RepID=A0A250XB10_9CHLO|nr:hypothetical protein CEUSTIGMA_g7389.t1 [Chlamydomonas eustigma]|eukprot:GAX79950.1 hypothetical protein CEUSTIGMA_g7389.t1 [Chlamydomonas eustigma]